MHTLPALLLQVQMAKAVGSKSGLRERKQPLISVKHCSLQGLLLGWTCQGVPVDPRLGSLRLFMNGPFSSALLSQELR